MLTSVLASIVSFFVGAEIQYCLDNKEECRIEREQRVRMVEVRNANELAWWRRH